MKKFLSIALAVCLLAVLCVPAFAAEPASLKDSAFSVINSINPNMSDSDKAAFKVIVTELNNSGALDDKSITKAELITAIEESLANEKITKAQSDAITDQVNNGDWDKLFNTTLTNAASGSIEEADIQATISQIKEILTGSLSTQEKATAIADMLSGYSTEQITAILNTLHSAGILDDDMYSKISDALNGGDTGITLPEGGADIGALDGLKDKISGLLAGLGIGGGSGDDTTTTTKKPASSNNNFEGGSAKTGDYAVASVAGIALVAGVAFVLTKKKK